MNNIQERTMEKEKEPLTKDGKTAYDVIHEIGNDNLPYNIRLPKARWMSQAALDYNNRREGIVKWYDENLFNSIQLSHE